MKDLKHAFRVLLQKKVWTAVVVLSLALGIGANTALFSAVNGLLLQTVPVPEPESLVRLKWAGQNDMVRNTSEYGSNYPDRGENVTATFSFDMYRKLKAANQTLTDIVGAAPQGTLNLVVDGSADLASYFYATGNYFPLLRVRPHLGRLIQESDDNPTAPAVAVISHALWVKRFGSDPKIEGRVVSMNKVPVTIVGVLPREFTGVQRAVDTAPEVTLPISLDPQLQTGQAGRLSQPTSYWIQILGRLKPGVTTEQVVGNLGGVFQAGAKWAMDDYQGSLSEADRGLANNKPRGTAVPRLVVSSASRGIYDPDTRSTQTASVLSGVVILILLLVCANVANLMLSRAAERRKEVSIRLSVGATRIRLIRQLVTESLVLAGLGGALGLLVGYWFRELLPFGQNSPIDWRVLAFTAGASAIAGLLFGIVPAVRATRVDLAGAMKENSRSVVASRSILSRALLVVQVAISIVLLVGAGLFLRTVGNLQRVDVGFNPTNLLMFRVSPQLNGYDVPRSQQLYRDVRTSLLAVPGVQAVGFATPAMLSGSRSTTQIYVQGSSQPQSIHTVTVTPEFFEAMQIPLLAGRLYTHQDDLKAPNVLVINEAAAKKMFPDGQFIGRLVGNTVEKNSDTQIIGVVRDVKYSSLRDAAPPTMYRTYLQTPAQGPGRSLVALVRTATDPNTRIDAVRSAVRQIDANMPVANVSTQTEQIERRFSQEQLFAMAYSWFGGLALVIAAVGLFGLMSYSVSRRTNEIGVRMALGANRTDVVRMVLRESMLLVAIGAVVGGGAAVAASPLVATTLFGIAPRDTATIAGAIVVMALVALAAAYLPARRASRVDPMFALRYE